MWKIHKFKLEIADENILDIPVNAEILDIQMQGNEMYAWVRLNTSQVNEKRVITTLYTGQRVLDDMMKYISTVQVGLMVYHFFESL